MAPDRSEDVLATLQGYFSAPIAKALLASTRRKANLAGAVDDGHLPDLVSALDHTLPVYLTDPARRRECQELLHRLVDEVTGHRPASPRPAAPRSPVPMREVPSADPSTVIRVLSADDVLNACEVGKDLCRQLGFAHLEQTKVATAIAEFARNILQYAKTGEIRITPLSAPKRGIEVIAHDKGPRIRNLELVMSTSYRSKAGMGMGLKGSRKLMDVFEVTSAPEVGTTVVARKYVS